MELNGKSVVVIGGARGMGAAAVNAFLDAGATVTMLDVVEPSRLATEDRDVTVIQCDVAVRTEVTEAMNHAVRTMGGLDCLVTTAAIQLDSPAESTSDDVWDRQFEINARGTFIANQVAFRYMRDGGGSIVNFASGAGVAGMPGAAAYSATKGAVLAWTRTIAREWGRYVIRANAVVPAIHTPMADEHRARLTNEEVVELEARHAREIPLGGKLGDPDEDMAPVLVFLASDGSRFITGQTICVNGGKLMLS